MNEETRIQNAILLALSGAGVLARRNMVGKFRPLHGDGVIKIGTPGEPDIMATVPILVRPEHVGQTWGVMLGIEVKTQRGRQSEQQKRYSDAIGRVGGVYELCRSTEEAMRIIRNLQSGRFTK